MKNISSTTELKSLIYNVRGKAVMLDSDLAGLYQVETRTLNQAVRRNIQCNSATPGPAAVKEKRKDGFTKDK